MGFKPPQTKHPQRPAHQSGHKQGNTLLGMVQMAAGEQIGADLTQQAFSGLLITLGNVQSNLNEQMIEKRNAQLQPAGHDHHNGIAQEHGFGKAKEFGPAGLLQSLSDVLKR